jgi:Photosynthetic reaction centre cytochrome C subunit
LTRSLAAFALAVSSLCAQSPNLGGVWKADPQKSKGLPPNSSFLEIIEQSGNRFTETSATTSARGEDRARIMFDLSGKEAKGQYRGLPIKSTAAWKDGALVIDAKQPGSTMKEKYALSADGKVLTVETDFSSNGREFHRVLVLDKQPDSAGEPLRKPEQTAGERFKNVKMLKDVPASTLLNTMRYFSYSLGKDCEHCHVKDHFDSEEKKEKETARKMMELSHDTNEKFFDGKTEVRCYTCHQGHDKPESSPAF